MVHTPKTPLIILGMTLATVAAHAVGMYGGGYLYVPHFDTFVHLLAGCWVGLIIISLATRLGLPKVPPATYIIAVASVTLAVGFGWELFEFILAKISLSTYGVKSVIQPGIGDTLKDLLTDLAGGAVAATLSVPSSPASDRYQKGTAS